MIIVFDVILGSVSICAFLYILKDDEDVRQRCKPGFIYQELVMTPFCCSLAVFSGILFEFFTI